MNLALSIHKKGYTLVDIDVAKEVLLGWEDLVDAEGQEVPFNKSTLNQLLEVRGFATAVGFAFMESNEEIFVKN
jgi:hypothetical protein